METVQSPRHLVAVFESPVAEALLRLGIEVGFRCTLVEPDPARLQGTPRPHGDAFVGDLSAAEVTEHTDIVLTDHHRPEIGEVLKEALATEARWIGIMGNPNREGPHLAALRALGVPDEEIAPGAPPDRSQHRQQDARGDRRRDAGGTHRRPKRPARRPRILIAAVVPAP